MTLRLSPSFEPAITARVLRTDTVENEQGRSFKLVALQFIGLEPKIQAQIRDALAPKFSFRIQEGSEEEGEKEEGETGIWSKVGITEMDPDVAATESEEESGEEGKDGS